MKNSAALLGLLFITQISGMKPSADEQLAAFKIKYECDYKEKSILLRQLRKQVEQYHTKVRTTLTGYEDFNIHYPTRAEKKMLKKLKKQVEQETSEICDETLKEHLMADAINLFEIKQHYQKIVKIRGILGYNASHEYVTHLIFQLAGVNLENINK